MEENILLLETLKSLKIIKDSNNTNEINLQNLEIITPFLISPITAHINSKKEINFKILNPKKSNVTTYLETIKFPQTNQDVKVKTSKKTYCPLYEIKNEMLGENYEIIDLLKEVIINKYDLKNNINTFLLVLDELMCNIQEHSKSNFNCIQAQKYDENLAISIVDSGISIPKNYINNGLRSFNSDLELLELVFKGISTKKEKERGTGIPNTYNLVCNALNGSLLIISRKAGFIKTPNEDIKFFDLDELGIEFQGTIINMFFKIPTEKIEYTKYLNKPILTN